LDKNRIIQLFINSAKTYRLNLVQLNINKGEAHSGLPYLEFSALKKTNLKELKKEIQKYLM
jgi:hypothetical protein